ncbi:MAG: DUF167 domain-containing protein [Gemmatimonas sp.]
MAESAVADAVAGGIVVQVRAAPKARREGIEGVATGARGPALKIAVSAAPADGRANARILELLAKALDVPKSAASIRTGAASRDKTIFVSGESRVLLDAIARIAPASIGNHHG